MKKSIYILSLLLFLQGCSPILALIKGDEIDEQLEMQQQVETFQDLLKSGWEMKIHDGKVVLIKETESGILINDVFGVLKSE